LTLFASFIGIDTGGYSFEIQDIISDKDLKVIHEDAAAKYSTFSNNQWVSFDDDETFKQKVDWANDVGLSGLMIWSIDQDDKEFSALAGLLGRSLQSYSSLLQRAVVSDAGKWTSINGQKCIITDCALPLSCPLGYGMAPNGGGFNNTCKGSKFKIICCPLNAMPSSCLWRGGESSVGRPSCHG
jgi:chitinase